MDTLKSSRYERLELNKEDEELNNSTIIMKSTEFEQPKQIKLRRLKTVGIGEPHSAITAATTHFEDGSNSTFYFNYF